jgi:hypothetical protein
MHVLMQDELRELAVQFFHSKLNAEISLPGDQAGSIQAPP